MRNFLLTTCIGAVAALAAGAGYANDELIRMSQNPKDWVMPTGNYANQRYSQLKEITTQNVGRLQVAWTFSTGVLRGHEGGPLVIGDVMYVHGPFPNPVFALDLNNDGKILWKYEIKQNPDVIPVMCCDTVNRGLAWSIVACTKSRIACFAGPSFHEGRTPAGACASAAVAAIRPGRDGSTAAVDSRARRLRRGKARIGFIV